MEKTETFNVDYKAAERIFDYGEEGGYRRDLYAWTHIATGINGFENVTQYDIDRFHDRQSTFEQRKQFLTEQQYR